MIQQSQIFKRKIFMISTSSSEGRNDLPASACMPGTGQTVRQGGAGKLWSTLQEVCNLLQIPADPTVANEEFLFQHVHFKAGQRVYTVGKSFENLFVVTAGFLKTVMVDDEGSEQILSFP